jgi:hypothetical protein
MTDEKYGTAEDPRWTGEQGRSPLPLLGYAVITGTFLLGVGGLLFRLERDGRLLEEVRLADLALLGLGSQQLSRMITRDRVTTVFRAPFTTYAGTRDAAPGEANEVARRSNTIQQAIGELVTCPFCMATWTTTALFGGYLVKPRRCSYARRASFHNQRVPGRTIALRKATS